jgi:hypothetical protein
VRICINDLAIGLRRAVMSLINNQQVGGGQLHAIAAEGTRMQRRHARHLHRLERPWRNAGLNNPVEYAAGVKLCAGLPDDLAAMREQNNLPQIGSCVADDFSADDGLSGARRRHEDDLVLSFGNRLVKLGDDVSLIGPKDRLNGMTECGIRT